MTHATGVRFLKEGILPHMWCPGCGIGTTVNCFARAVSECGLDLDKIAIVSGIGCTGRMSGYVDFNTLHTTHGRAPAFATGLKMARPDMTVIVVMGDGDSASARCQTKKPPVGSAATRRSGWGG